MIKNETSTEDPTTPKPNSVKTHNEKLQDLISNNNNICYPKNIHHNEEFHIPEPLVVFNRKANQQTQHPENLSKTETAFLPPEDEDSDTDSNETLKYIDTDDETFTFSDISETSLQELLERDPDGLEMSLQE